MYMYVCSTCICSTSPVQWINPLNKSITTYRLLCMYRLLTCLHIWALGCRILPPPPPPHNHYHVPITCTLHCYIMSSPYLPQNSNCTTTCPSTRVNQNTYAYICPRYYTTQSQQCQSRTCVSHTHCTSFTAAVECPFSSVHVSI